MFAKYNTHVKEVSTTNGVENQGLDFGDFPIQIAENSQKRPYFEGSYLGNRVKLEGKWAHFGKRRSRATTYIEMEENFVLTPSPPLSP